MRLSLLNDLWFSTVDVRDVAAAHCAALTAPDAAGERFACWAQDTSFFEWSRILSETFGPMGYKVPRGRLPKWIMRISSAFCACSGHIITARCSSGCGPRHRRLLSVLVVGVVLALVKLRRERHKLRSACTSIHDSTRSPLCDK